MTFQFSVEAPFLLSLLPLIFLSWQARCVNCRSGYYSLDGEACLPCSPGTIARPVKFFKRWSILPPEFMSICTSAGKCDSGGWIPSGNYIRTGYSVGTLDSKLQWKEFTIGRHGGTLSFYCSINCTLRSEIRLPQTHLPASKAKAPRHRNARVLAPSNECHFEILILGDQGLVSPPMSCAPNMSRDGSIFHHSYNLDYGNYSVLWVV